MSLRLPRTIRLDASDTVVFATPAQPGEWAVTGMFLFAGQDAETLSRKARIAFRTGFLGIASFGFSTLVVVSDATPAERAQAVEALARQLVERLGAPDLDAARPAAQEEIALSESLCARHPAGTLVALHRAQGEHGAITERFRTLRPRAETVLGGAGLRGHDRAFSVVETDAPEDPADRIDLVALLKGRRR